jgi:hypothetical protein
MSQFSIRPRLSVLGGMSAIVLAIGCSSSSSSGPSGLDGSAGGSSASSGRQGSSGSSGTSSGSAGTTSGSRGSTSGAQGLSVDAGAAGYCDMIQSNGECFDYIDGFTVADAQKDCSIHQGTYSSSGMCSTASSVGGCRQDFANGPIETTWYYSPITADRVMPTCAADGNATYVAP